MENILRDLINQEKDVFEFDAEVVYQAVMKLVSKCKITSHPSMDLLINKTEYEVIQTFLRFSKPERESIPYEPLKLLEKIYSLSQLKNWCQEYLKGLLTKKKFKPHQEDILSLVELIAIRLDFNLLEFLEQFFENDLGIYVRNPKSNARVFWFEEIEEQIKQYNLVKDISLPGSRDFSFDIRTGSCGCSECELEPSLDKLTEIEKEAKDLIGGVEDDCTHLTAFSETLDDKVSEVYRVIDGMLSELDAHLMNYWKSEDENKLNILLNDMCEALYGKFPSFNAETFGKEVRGNFRGWAGHLDCKKFNDFNSYAANLQEKVSQLEDFESSANDLIKDIESSRCECVSGRWDVSYSSKEVEGELKKLSKKEDSFTDLMNLTDIWTVSYIRKQTEIILDDYQKEGGLFTVLFAD